MQHLLGGPRAELDPEDVAAAVSLASGATMRHGVDLFNVAGEPLDASVNFESGEVTWAFRPPDDVTGASNEATEVRLTANLTIAGQTALFLEAIRYQLWTEFLSPADVWVRFNKIYGVATNPPLDDDGKILSRTLKIADKTHRYRTVELNEPLSIAPGAVCATWVAEDLASRFGETTVSFPASTAALVTGKTFEAGTSILAVYNALLETAALDQLTIDEDTGHPRTVALATLANRGTEITYGAGRRKIVPAGGVEPLLAESPNRLRFVARQGPSLAEEGNGITIRSNQSTGPASIDRRGEVIEKRVDVEAENQTQLEEIADAQQHRWFAGGGLRYTGHVGLNPMHSDRDVAELILPRLNLSGAWLVTQWTYPMHPIASEADVLMPITLERRV